MEEIGNADAIQSRAHFEFLPLKDILIGHNDCLSANTQSEINALVEEGDA